MADVRDLTAIEAIAEIGRGAVSADEVFEAYRAASAADDLGAYTWVAPSSPPPAADGPLAGLPVAVKDLFCISAK